MFKNCEFCGKEYETHNSKSKYCSISCSNKGRNHKNVKCNCDVCGKEIEIIFSRYNRGKHHYCSIECQSKGKTLFYTGNNNPLCNKIAVNCETCGKKIKVNQYKYEHQTHFCCSNECKTEGYKKIFIGKNNPFYGISHNQYTKLKISKSNKGKIAWNKGYKVPWKTDEERDRDRTIYGDQYNKWRSEVFERDDFACQCCGDSKGGNLNAHHLDGYNWCKEKRLDVNNGITLCEKCHNNFHSIYGNGNNTLEQFLKFIENKENA